MFYFPVIEKANIQTNLFKLKDNHLTIENPSDMNMVTENSPIIWSNENIWKVAETEWVAKYVLKERPNSDSDHYIKSFVYGIIEASTTLNYTFSYLETVETIINNTEFDTLNTTNNLDNSSLGDLNSSLPVINITYGNSE